MIVRNKQDTVVNYSATKLGSDWGLVASTDFKSDGPRLIPGTVGSIPTHFRQQRQSSSLSDRTEGCGVVYCSYLSNVIDA